MVLIVALFTLAKPELIPPIAHVLGIRVGHNGRGRLEQVFGIGDYEVGGHPDGTELWLLSRPHSQFEVEGFAYTRHEGELIENFRWRQPSNAKLKPSRHSETPPGWLGKITLGMPQAVVLRIADRVLGSHSVKNGEYHWTQRGRTVPIFLNEKQPYTKWEATAKFTSEKLSDLEIHCE